VRSSVSDNYYIANADGRNKQDDLRLRMCSPHEDLRHVGRRGIYNAELAIHSAGTNQQRFDALIDNTVAAKDFEQFAGVVKGLDTVVTFHDRDHLGYTVDQLQTEGEKG
jgi:hypothetical protein